MPAGVGPSDGDGLAWVLGEGPVPGEPAVDGDGEPVRGGTLGDEPLDRGPVPEGDGESRAGDADGEADVPLAVGDGRVLDEGDGDATATAVGRVGTGVP